MEIIIPKSKVYKIPLIDLVVVYEKTTLTLSWLNPRLVATLCLSFSRETGYPNCSLRYAQPSTHLVGAICRGHTFIKEDMGKVCFMPVMVDLSMFCRIFGAEGVMPEATANLDANINPLIHCSAVLEVGLGGKNGRACSYLA